MIIIKRKFSIEALGIFCCGLILFTAGLSQQEIIGFESRFYLFAREMWQQGPNWFPTTYHNPYPDYPVTGTLFIYWISKCFGQLDKLSAVFPSAFASAVTLATTYLIGSLQSRRWGIYAVFFMLLTNTFIMEARTISPDQYIAMVTTLSFYFAYSAKLLHRPARLWFIPLCFAIGFACRGPIGLVVPAGVMCVFYLLDKDFKHFFVVGLLAVLVLIAGCAALFGAAFHVGGMDFVQDVLRMEVSGRLQDASLPWYFYWVESFGAYAVTFPVAILMVAGVGRHLFRTNIPEDLRLMEKLLGWALVILIGLTIPAGKKIRYVIAFVPALALISAYLFVLPPKAKYLILLRKSIYCVGFVLPLLCFILAIIAFAETTFKTPTRFMLGFANGLQPNLPSVIVLFFILQVVSFFYRKREMVVLGIASLTFVMTYVSIVEPINLALNHTRDFVEMVETSRHMKGAELIFYRENPDGLPIKYVMNMPREEVPAFISDSHDILQVKKRAYFVATPQHFLDMPKSIASKVAILYKGNIGHVPIVVFAKLD
ncbi:MAG: glycosyltransferase family 39 protein [Gammaproteobacteria bacterium]|nr:glycosyltransferase family 39 protein [Gammaproteobacteria bacterium]